MRKLIMLLTPLLVLALVLTAVGCGGDDEEKPTPTPTPTPTGETPTPTDGTEVPTYTGPSITFKVSHGSNLGTYGANAWEYRNERLQYWTNGKCKLQIFPAFSLYRGLEEWDAIATGGVDMISISDWMPQMNGMMDWIIGYYPYFWGTDHMNAWEHDKRFWDHPDGGGVMLAQLEERGIKGVGMIYSGSWTMNVAREEMKSQHDMEGWKAMSVGGMSDLIVHAVPCIPVFIDPAETTIAFEQGLVDVLFRDPSSTLSSHLYETAKYGLLSSVVAPHSVLAMNLDKWNSLTPELQDIFTNKIVPEAIAYNMEVVKPKYLEEIELLQTEEYGMTIHWMTLEERVSFRESAFALAEERGYTELMDIELLKLADRLRQEPYDQGELLP